MNANAAILNRLRPDWFYWFGRLVVAVWLFAMVVPVAYVLGLSFSESIGSTFAYIFPSRPTIDNYTGAVTFFGASLGVSLWQMLGNGFIYSIFSIVATIFVSSTAAFAFATMRFRGRTVQLVLLLTPLVLPVSMLLIPEFLNLKFLNLLGGYQTVILPEVAFSVAVPMLIMMTYFRGLPAEIFEAARIDGCDNLALFRHVAFPMAMPAIATSVILLFLSVWNEYPLALIGVGNNVQLWNISLALASIETTKTAEVPWEIIAATIVVASIPVTLVFAFFQRRLLSGLEGSLKG